MKKHPKKKRLKKRRGRALRAIGVMALLVACGEFMTRTLEMPLVIAGPEKVTQGAAALTATLGILLITWGLSREINSVRRRIMSLDEELEEVCDTFDQELSGLKPQPPEQRLRTA